MVESERYLSEQEAGDALRVLVRRRDDPVLRLLDDAPEEDEEISADEDTAAAESRAELNAGAPTMSVDEFRRYA